MKAAIYARTSTDDGRQELETQTRELKAYAAQMHWTVVNEYLDQISGRKANRPQFQRAIEDARKPGRPLATVAAITREAPLASLFVAFLFGLAIARRR